MRSSGRVLNMVVIHLREAVEMEYTTHESEKEEIAYSSEHEKSVWYGQFTVIEWHKNSLTIYSTRIIEG